MSGTTNKGLIVPFTLYLTHPETNGKMMSDNLTQVFIPMGKVYHSTNEVAQQITNMPLTLDLNQNPLRMSSPQKPFKVMIFPRKNGHGSHDAGANFSYLAGVELKEPQLLLQKINLLNFRHKMKVNPSLRRPLG